VLDALGVRSIPHLALGFQKFVGVEYRLAEPHGLAGPIIMDATVPQVDGYKFVYTLPLAADRVLIEDTTYSDGPGLPAEAIQERLPAYAHKQGWNIVGIERVENGVLPIIIAGDLDALERDERSGPPRIGLAGTFFHPTTGYSLPDALRVADEIVHAFRAGPRTTFQVRDSLNRYRRKIWAERSYFRWLNRLLFQAGQPDKRYKIIQRFYGFETELVQRFYACSLTRADQLRIMIGRPPVPILSALKRVSEPAALRRWKEQR
jgi:lycopene beta-cyclase